MYTSVGSSQSRHQQRTSWATSAESGTRPCCRWSDCCSTTIALCLLSLQWRHSSWTTLSEYDVHVDSLPLPVDTKTSLMMPVNGCVHHSHRMLCTRPCRSFLGCYFQTTFLLFGFILFYHHPFHLQPILSQSWVWCIGRCWQFRGHILNYRMLPFT